MKNYKLPKRELELLRREHKKAMSENQARIADKIKAIYLLGNSWKVSDICEALLLDDNTIYRYYEIYKEHGLTSLIKNNYQGKDIQLTEYEQDSLDSFLQTIYCRTTKQAIEYVKREFDVKYSVSGMNALLKRLDFTYRKPRVVPGKADQEEQKKFIKKYRKIRKHMQSEDSLFFMDGVHPQHNPIVQCGWFKKGKKQILKTNTQYHRLHINGVVNIDTKKVIVGSHSRLDEDATLDMLEKLRKYQPSGKIYLVLDNAGYYNTNVVKKYAKHTEITLLYLPPYSPNLNLIERLWGLFQRETLYNHYYPTFEELKQACMHFFAGLSTRKKELCELLTEKFETLPI